MSNETTRSVPTFRSTSMIGSRYIIGIFGMIYVILAIVRGILWGETAPLSSVLLVSIFIGGPGLVLLYGAYWLPQSDVHPEFYATVAKWSLAGFGVMLGILTSYHILAVGGIANTDRAIPILTALSTAAGFGVGLHDAQAKTRTRELKQRNRELQQIQTELEETVGQLQRSNERLEQFAHAASHDLQEPLRMVSTYLQLIERRYEDDLDEEGEEYLEFAVDGADRMRSMIDGLLEYSRVETDGEPFQPVELDTVLEDAREDLQVKIEETDATITADPLPCVEGDPNQLRQLLQNLLENAIEYTDGSQPRVHVAAERNGTEWKVSVRDEGIGIDSDAQERIFEVFEREHNREEYDGSGIGLALCQRIIERHDGEIWVDSEPGEGSTFSFTVKADGEDDG